MAVSFEDRKLLNSQIMSSPDRRHGVFILIDLIVTPRDLFRSLRSYTAVTITGW